MHGSGSIVRRACLLMLAQPLGGEIDRHRGGGGGGDGGGGAGRDGAGRDRYRYVVEGKMMLRRRMLLRSVRRNHD